VKAATRSAWLLLALSLTACTPMRSTVPPPYRYQHVDYDEQGMQTAAMDYCAARNPDDAQPEFPFTTDGCSMAPDGKWGECCLAHDVRYWCGGTRDDRLEADRALKACLMEHKGPVVAGFYYLGTRAGGWRRVPFGWRWGYGDPWPAAWSPTAE
jgi:hypothetical protein